MLPVATPRTAAIFVVQNFSTREAREDFHAQRLSLLAQPFGERAQADDVVAVVGVNGGQQHVGHAGAGLFAEEHDGIVRHRLVQRRAAFFPIGEQLVQRNRVHDRARQNVRARLRAFFQHDDRDIRAFFSGELLQADGRRQTTGAATDDDDVVFHGFARAVRGEDLLWGHGRLSCFKVAVVT